MTGREKEIKILNELYNSDSAELVAVYGRRRIGKTYLIDETFGDRITFRHAGLSPIEQGGNGMKMQLKQFHLSLLTQGMKKCNIPKDWLEAFFLLENFLQERDDGRRQVVFLDELPWLDTPKSGFITAFEGFWNSWACHRHSIMVIVSGSANSWILDKLINNHGGLYGRVTREIHLMPFTLAEAKALFSEQKIAMSDYDIVQSYMIFGGVPYYLKHFQRGKSLAQNVDDILFCKGAPLKDEFERLFQSVFSRPEAMLRLVRTIGQKRKGITRKEISSISGIPSGAGLTQNLNALILSGFAEKYVPFDGSRREPLYRLTDPFCLFCLHFLIDREADEDFWKANVNLPSVVSWRGLAFENVCFEHIRQIKKALEIAGVRTTASSWSVEASETKESGSQIDMLIDRNDNVINMCEMKFCTEEFAVTKNYDMVLRRRFNALSEKLKKNKAIHRTLITTYGLKYNEYSGDFDNVITMEALFS